MTPPQRRTLHVFEGDHPHWRGEVCLYSDGRMARPGIDQGSYELVERQRLLLNWDHWGPAELLWNDALEAYLCVPQSFTLREVSPQAIRWAFVNFWPGFDDRTFEQHLVQSSGKRQFRLSEQDPEIVFECVFGPQGVGRERWPEALQVWYTAENVAPPPNSFDRFISFHRRPDDPRHLRWPYFLLHLELLKLTLHDLVRQGPPEQLPHERPRFCAFVAANGGCQTRNRFVEQLSKYRAVDCPGRVLNNMPSAEVGQRGDLRGKINFLKQYKFAVCFENSSTRGSGGYVTEKLVDAMLAGCIPLYWGDCRVGEDFNPRSFVELSVYGDDVEAMVRHVIQLDQDDDACRAMVDEPWLPNNTPPPHLTIQQSDEFIQTLLKIRTRESEPRTGVWS